MLVFVLIDDVINGSWHSEIGIGHKSRRLVVVSTIPKKGAFQSSPVAQPRYLMVSFSKCFKTNHYKIAPLHVTWKLLKCLASSSSLFVD